MGKRFSGLRDAKSLMKAFVPGATRVRRPLQPNEMFASEGMEPTVPNLCAIEDMAMDDSLEACIALRLLDMLGATRGGVHVEAMIARMVAMDGQAVAAGVGNALRKLFDNRQVAGCGGTFCLPEQVAQLRQSWLISGALAHPGRNAREAAERRESYHQLMHWNGWNMPVYFMQGDKALQ